MGFQADPAYILYQEKVVGSIGNRRDIYHIIYLVLIDLLMWEKHYTPYNPKGAKMGPLLFFFLNLQPLSCDLLRYRCSVMYTIHAVY